MTSKPSLTVITPTIGRECLDRQIDSIAAQRGDFEIVHLLLWDDYRDPAAKAPESYNSASRFSLIAPPGTGRNEAAPGSILRAIGLIAARTDLVTFADDDVWWEPDHVETLTACLAGGLYWGSSLRKIWAPDGRYLGIDRFESIGDDPGRETPYEMCDNNVMIFRRELGIQAAGLYRTTTAYNDDRLMYEFLKGHGGPRGRTGLATINQISPDFLVGQFTSFCAPE